MDETLDLLVIGAGPAGLCRAFWRRRAEPAMRMRILEASANPGGWLQTNRIEGFVCETGPQALRPNEDSDALMEALGIGSEVVPASPAAKDRFIGRAGRLHRLPAGPIDLLRTPLLTLGGKARILSERFRRGGGAAGETLGAFVARRFGRQAVPLAQAMASGIFAGDAQRLEMEAAFPRVVAWERQHGSVFKALVHEAKARGNRPARPTLVSLRAGMQGLVQALRGALASDLLCGRAATKIESCDEGFRVHLDGEPARSLVCRQLALAIPAHRAAMLLAPLDAELANELAAIRFASVVNVHLGFWASDASALSGFGFLLDPAEPTPFLGAIYCSSLFPAAAQKGKFLVRIMGGGTLHPELITQAANDPDAVARQAEAMLRRYSGLSGPLLFRRVGIAQDAIPQYENGHRARVERIRERSARLGPLTLIGNSYDEVSTVGQMRSESGPL